jgi:hypothetical protein
MRKFDNEAFTGDIEIIGPIIDRTNEKQVIM